MRKLTAPYQDENMRSAYETLGGLEPLKSYIDEHRGIGRLSFYFQGWEVNLAWLKGHGLGWVDTKLDFPPYVADEIEAHLVRGGQIDIIPFFKESRAFTTMKVVEALMQRGHNLALQITKKKTERAATVAREMGFTEDHISHELIYTWTVHHSLSSKRVLVTTSMFGYVHVDIPPKTLFSILTSDPYSLRLVNIYEVLVRGRVDDPIGAVADTPEKRATLLAQMLAGVR